MIPYTTFKDIILPCPVFIELCFIQNEHDDYIEIYSYMYQKLVRNMYKISAVSIQFDMHMPTICKR